MSTLTAPAPTGGQLAPQPVGDPYSLLDAARIVEDGDRRYLGGIFIESYPAGPASIHDPCATGTFRVKSIDAEFAKPNFNAFTAYLGVTCTSASFGPTLEDAKRKLAAAFTATETVAVERVLAAGEPGSSFGPYLGDSSMEDLGTQDPTEALALLEQAIRGHGGGMIHVPPVTATYWASLNLVTAERNQLRTNLGTIVAVGAGYEAVRPDGATAPGASTEWAFASGIVVITRSELMVIPDSYGESLDRSSNDVTLIAERNYLLSFVGREESTNFVQAGVLVNRA